MTARTIEMWMRLMLLLLMTAVGWPAEGGEDSLTLRVNDSQVRPGGQLAVVLRTYASRPAGQGQLCFRANHLRSSAARGAQGSPFVAFEGGEIFSSADDTVADFSFDGSGAGPLLVAEFSSVSNTINDQDGPLAVFYFRLDPAIDPGTSFELALDLADTFLEDPTGTLIPLDSRAGELIVIAIDDPFELSASGDEAMPGSVAELAASTEELELLSGGQVTFLYDQSIVDGVPEVRIDPRVGTAKFEVEHGSGMTRVDFESIDATLNEVPGDLITLVLPISESAPVGTISPLTFDLDTTFLFDQRGASIPLELEGDFIAVVSGPEVFSDGFESGDLSEWQ